MLNAELHLTLLLLIPGFGALIIALVPTRKIHLLRSTALFFTSITFLFSLLLFTQFDSGAEAMQFVLNVPWLNVGVLNIHYHVGIDGISLFLVLLTTFLMPLAILASWSIQEKIRPYMFFMLLLEVGMIGVFVSLDLILFYKILKAQLLIHEFNGIGNLS